MEQYIAKMHIDTSKLMGVDFLPTTGVQQTACKENHKQSLVELEESHDATCPHCTLETGFTQTVFGCGNPDASLMFIGEAPGQEEDIQGIPFVGAAGQKLDQIIDAMGFQRNDVYIANVLKSRPPNNRTPLADEIEGCGPFLKQQIEIIKPEVIVTLGSPATKFLLNTTQGITSLRGTWHLYEGIPVMPTYHPAYMLRNYTKETRQEVWSDMQAVISKLLA